MGKGKKVRTKSYLIYGKEDVDMEMMKSVCSEQQVNPSARKTGICLLLCALLPAPPEEEGTTQNSKIKAMHQGLHVFHCCWQWISLVISSTTLCA